MHSFKVVDFSEDSDLVSSIGQCVLDLLHILDRCNIWYQNVIKVVLDGHSNDIVFVLILQDRQLSQSMTWNENRVALLEHTIFLELNLDTIKLSLEHNRS